MGAAPAWWRGGSPEPHRAVSTGQIREELGFTDRVSRRDAPGQAVAWVRAAQAEQIPPGSFDYPREDRAPAELRPH